MITISVYESDNTTNEGQACTSKTTNEGQACTSKTVECKDASTKDTNIADSEVAEMLFPTLTALLKSVSDTDDGEEDEDDEVDNDEDEEDEDEDEWSADDYAGLLDALFGDSDDDEDDDEDEEDEDDEDDDEDGEGPLDRPIFSVNDVLEMLREADEEDDEDECDCECTCDEAEDNCCSAYTVEIDPIDILAKAALAFVAFKGLKLLKKFC